MRIGFFGDGPWAHLALEKIREHDNFEIAYIIARYDTQDPYLKKQAELLGIPFLVFQNVNSNEVIGQLSTYSVDINVSMSFNQILRKSIINIAKMGFINCHAGLLPYYRGRNVLNWALINGEKEFGVTVHFVDEGIDTGDIILQQKVDILDNDDYGTLLEKAYVLCADTLCKALCMLSSSKVSLIEQSSIHPVGLYCGRRKNGDEYIDWSWSSKRIFDFIRGITKPGPGARIICDSKEYIVWKAELICDAPDYICTPGEIVGRDAAGIVFKTGDSSIICTKISNAIEPERIIDLHDKTFKIGRRFINYEKWQIALAHEEIKKMQSLHAPEFQGS